MKNRKIAIWGTGEISGVFSQRENIKPDIYIDNNIDKKGQFFLEKTIVHPTDIKDWSEYYIIVANRFYPEIREQLISYGLKEDIDFVSYVKVEDNETKLEGLIKELSISLKRLREEYSGYKKRPLIIGSMVAFDKRSYLLYNEAAKKYDFLMISETYAVEDKAKQGLIEFPFFLLPLMLWQNYHLKHNSFTKLDPPQFIKEYVKEKEYLVNAMEDFIGKNHDIAKDYAFYFVYHADKYLREMFSFLEPTKVYIWNMFYPFHIIIRHICKEMDIPLYFMEYGVLPGTYLVEQMGQMGESYPAVHSEEFQKLSVDKTDIAHSKKVYDFLYESGINRKDQPVSDIINRVKEQLIPNRPTVVFYGQNDYESGLYPYTDTTKKYHSPIFKGSNETASYLALMAERNNWNFIYKPHPICVVDGQRPDMPDSAVYIDRCNINELVDLGDLNITILSTVAYVSLVRRKPVLMLGYTQLKNKGCTYEAFDESIIEEQISIAIEKGYTNEQENAFIEHIARVTKYYAYDDMSDRPIRYGKDWHEIINYDSRF